MKKITEFIINNKIYCIFDTDKIEGKDTYVGESRYEQGVILIERGTKEQMLITLRHELAHVWLYENGHSIQQEGCFTYEDLCEYIALSCNSVYNITEQYKKEKGW